MVARRRQQFLPSPEELTRLRRTPIPDRIKCSRCEKNLIAAKYSDKQLDRLRQEIQSRSTVIGIVCRQCNGEPATELQCVVCGHTKGLEEFAKAQRKADNCRCYQCTDELVNTKPIDHHNYMAGKHPFDNPKWAEGPNPEYFSNETSDVSDTTVEWNTYKGDDSHSSQYGGVALPTRYQSTASSGASLISTENDAAGVVRDLATSWHTQSVGAGSTKADQYGHSIGSSTSASARSFPSSVAERSVGPSTGLTTPGSMPQMPKLARPMGDTEHETGVGSTPWALDDDDYYSDEDCYEDSDGENTVI